jgi:hypothetical protein
MSDIDKGGIVRQWFATAGCAVGLVLPDGWFGRPYDNIYHIATAHENDGVLVIHLVEQLWLRFEGPSHVKVVNSELVIDGFVQCVVQWQIAGTLEYDSSTFSDGQVRFIPPLGSII